MANIIPFRERRAVGRLAHADYLGQNERRSTAAIARAIHPALAEFDRLRRDLEDERRRLLELIDAAWIKLIEVSRQPDEKLESSVVPLSAIGLAARVNGSVERQSRLARTGQSLPD